MEDEEKEMENPEEEIKFWIQRAGDIGFTAAVRLDPGTLKPRKDIRDMCEENRCGAYQHNWTCPPECGTLEECAGKMAVCRSGLLVQTVGKLNKTIDTKSYAAIEKQHMKQFARLADEVRIRHPEALCLGAGGCRNCDKCAYPEPCRFPEHAFSSMESYGLFVTQVCRDNGLPYYYGARTICYTACILF